MGTRLSLRPDLDQDVGLLALYVSGNLPNAKPGLAYEGRLKIHNAEGACTAEQIGGDTLPPGSSVFVDNATQQVVVAWPAYAEFVTPLQNPNFESGDLSGWTLTPKGGTATATADTSQKFDGAYSLRWPGGKGLGSEGGIEVEAWNNTIGPCLPGQRVTSHARCMYNPGGHNFGSRYQGLLRFLDGAGMPIGPAVRGRQFKGRGENGRWNDASATGVGPVGTKGVQMGAWLTGSNAPVWLDSASWDVPSSVGINIETTLNLMLRVRDSAGRTALWYGEIVVLATARDPLYGYVYSVMNFEGVGANFIDGKGLQWLAQGGVVQADGAITLAVDGQSIYSDPLGEVEMPGDFTVEAWITPTSFNPQWSAIINFGLGSAMLALDDSGRLMYYVPSAGIISTAAILSVEKKVHVAVERKGGLVTTAVDGVVLNAPGAYVDLVIAGTIGIGADQRVNSFFRGAVHASRITIGVARYGGGTFAPDADPFPEG